MSRITRNALHVFVLGFFEFFFQLLDHRCRLEWKVGSACEEFEVNEDDVSASSGACSPGERVKR